LWKVEGWPAPLYLAGSIHVMQEKDPLPEVYFSSLEQCRRVFFEIHPSDLNDPEKIRLMKKAGRLPRGASLGDVLSQDLLEELQRVAGPRYSTVRPLQPWMAALQLVQSELQALGRDTRWGVDQRLYRLARDRGMAVVVNEPFNGGALFGAVRGRELPAWAAEWECESWAQLFLKYIASHPAVTATVPATSDPEHLVDNMGAGRGLLPDAEERRRLETLVSD